MRCITGEHSSRGRSSRAARLIGALIALLTVSAPGPAQEPERSAAADWPTYNRDLAGTRYSPLDQINTRNVTELQEVWSYRFHPEDGFIEGPSPTELFQQVTPIVVDGVMYLAAGNRVVALRPETGVEIWRHELSEGLASFRGVAYGPGSDTREPRIYFTSLRKVVALKARTGERDAMFGNQGEVELRIPYAGVPVVYKDTLILGSNAFGPGQEHITPHLNQPRGGGEPAYAYPRALSAETGQLLWEFPTVPRETDFGNHTWGDRSWRDRIGNNVWAVTLTVDEDRGLVYMPVSSPGSNFYGGDRPGDNLFANSTIAIDIQTGDLEWYFQNIHRELWDYNLPPAPGLFEIERDGERIPVLAQVGKSAFMFILNRETGEPVHGVEERPVPAGDVPGEWYSPTQPIPLNPPPLARVSIGPDDIVTADDTTAAHAAACRELWDAIGYYNEGPYTPLRLRQEGTPPSLVFPGTGGGVNWGGTAYDPEIGYIFVNSKDQPISGWMDENPLYGPDTLETQVPYVRSPAQPFEAPIFDDAGTRLGALPCYQPPWARLYAVNAGTGEIVWEVPLGINTLLPEGKQRVGTPSVGGAIVTAGGLVFIGATTDRMFRAFDSRTGEELWSAAFDYNVEAVPITYGGSDGRQYLAVNVSAPATGEPRGNERLVVFSLPGQLPEDVHRTSRSRLPPIDREALDPTRREAYDAAMRAAGSGGAPTGAAALRLHGSGTDLRFSGPLGRRLTELAILTTAREHDQPYEWALHELDALAVGLDELLIDVVRHRKPITSVGDPEAIVMEVGRELFATRRLGSDTYARALARLGRTNLVDLIDLMGRYASTAATLTAFNQQMPLGWRQSLPLPFTYPDDIHPDSRSRLPLRPGPYRTSVSALYGRMASPGGLGPGQIRAYGEGLPTLEARVGERLMMLAILVTARAHDSQYDWTVNEPQALGAGLEPEVIDVIRNRRPLDGLDEKDATLIAFARELFGDYNVGAEIYMRAASAFGVRDLIDIVGLMGAHAADAAVLAGFDQQLPKDVEPRLPLP